MRADELMRELESDPAWFAKQKKRELLQAERRDVHDADQKQLVGEINAAGYQINCVWDLVNNTAHEVLERNFTGEYPVAYPILIKHLTLDHLPAIREGIIRALTVSDGGNEVAWALLGEFERETNADLKWVISNALRTVMNRKARKQYPAVDEYYSNHGRRSDAQDA